jgi:hypothetical protein
MKHWRGALEWSGVLRHDGSVLRRLGIAGGPNSGQ